MVDDLLPPDFNKKGKKKKRRDEQKPEFPADSPLADISSDETSPEDLPDLGGGDFDDFFEPAAKPKKSSSKGSKDKADAAPADEWAEAPDEILADDSIASSGSSAESSEWEFGGPDEAQTADKGTSEWEDVGGADANAFSFDESETTASSSKPQETYDFGEPEWETPDGSVEETQETASSKPEDEWAEAPEFTSSFSEGYEEPEADESATIERKDLGPEDDAGASSSMYMGEDDHEPNLANSDEAKPDEEPMKAALDNAKPPFMQSKQGRLVMMVGGGLLVILIVLIPIVLFLAPSSEKKADETTTTIGSKETTTTIASVPGGSGTDETTTTTLIVPVVIEEATPDVTTPANIEFKDPFEPLPVGSMDGVVATTDIVTDPNAKVLILTRVSLEEGTEYSYVTYDGAGYKVQEGERVGVSPYQVKSIGADYTLFLFGDDSMALRVGESIVK